MYTVGRLASAALVAVWIAVSPGVAHASPFSVPIIRIDAGANTAGANTAPPESMDEIEDGDDPSVVEAKSEYRAGSDAYALGNYEEAVAHFERAFELSQEPALLFNLGQSYTRWYDISNDVEHLKKARRLYENYVLNVGATGLDEEQQAQARSDAQRRISEVDRRIAQHDDSHGQTDAVGKPIHKKAWFWVAIVGGLALVGGVSAAAVLTTRKPGFEPELGTLGRAPNGPSGTGLTLRF